MRALIFGHGYLGQAFAGRLRADGWGVTATAREPDKRRALAEAGLAVVDPADAGPMAQALAEADALLITAAPAPAGCPALKALGSSLEALPKPLRWVGYISSTSVYGDRGGKWVNESSALNAPTVEGARRAAAERDWLGLGWRSGSPVAIFRLPAIYGPGRTPFEKLADGTARIVRKPGQVFNRIHLDDAVAALAASLARPRAGGVYNVTDDEPAGADAYVEHAARLMGVASPPEVDWTDPEVSAAMRRFYLDNKRVSSARAKAELGWRPRYASWRDGLKALAPARGPA
ncbi:MAG: NAD(P)H-binding protein [Proteobacteria bacterium]|nr:NAD(P)H-binding protein [Pseudomonadota bacterium]